jgi:hypothetical protein
MVKSALGYIQNATEGRTLEEAHQNQEVVRLGMASLEEILGV